MDGVFLDYRQSSRWAYAKVYNGSAWKSRVSLGSTGWAFWPPGSSWAA